MTNDQNITIKMQFPKSDTNPYYDGLVHEIEPKDFKCLKDSIYYYLWYYDVTANFDAVTLLIDKNGTFYKVPLDDYDKYEEMVFEMDVTDISFELLPDEIQLSDSMKFEDLEEELGEKKDDIQLSGNGNDGNDNNPSLEEEEETKKARTPEPAPATQVAGDGGNNNNHPHDNVIQMPTRRDNSRIFTDESRIDPAHSYLTVDNARNLGYLDEDDDLDNSKHMQKKGNVVKRFFGKWIDINNNIIDKIESLKEDEEFEPIELDLDDKDNIKGFEPKDAYADDPSIDGFDPNKQELVDEQVKIIDDIVDAMVNNQIDVNGNPIGDENINPDDKHIA